MAPVYFFFKSVVRITTQFLLVFNTSFFSYLNGNELPLSGYSRVQIGLDSNHKEAPFTLNGKKKYQN